MPCIIFMFAPGRRGQQEVLNMEFHLALREMIGLNEQNLKPSKYPAEQAFARLLLRNLATVSDATLSTFRYL